MVAAPGNLLRLFPDASAGRAGALDDGSVVLFAAGVIGQGEAAESATLRGRLGGDILGRVSSGNRESQVPGSSMKVTSSLEVLGGVPRT